MGGVIIGNIPFASLVAFAQRYGIDDITEFDEFAAIMRELDQIEVTHLNAKLNPKS